MGEGRPPSAGGAESQPEPDMEATLSAGHGLSEEERRRYRRDGLVQPAWDLPADAHRRALEALDDTLAATEGQPPESIVCPHIPNWNGLPEEITRTWLELAGLPEVLEPVASVLGSDLILWGSQLFCKPSRRGMEVPWHQDGEYWPIRPLATCTVWIALDPAGPDNGCMRYIPGSHRQERLFPHRLDARPDVVLNQQIEPGYRDEAGARDNELPPGGFSLHDVYLIHGSQPNRSGRRRAAYALRFMPATSHFDRSLRTDGGSAHYQTHFATRPLYLVRGRPHTNRRLVFEHPARRP